MPRRTAFPAQALAVLAALAARPSAWRHGYDLARETGLKSGTLYPILVRLAGREIVQACWEEGEPAGRLRRHLYRLTSDGLAAAAALAVTPAPAAGAARPGRAAPAAGSGGSVMERLTWVLAGMLRHAAVLLPPGRQEWAEAVRAEAGQVPAGWPRLRWLAGGLRLAAREGAMMMIGTVVYRLGAVAVAALAAWVVWLSWRVSPAADPQTVTVRVLVGVAALVVLPWVGRRRGWFGPVRASVAARLVRLAGCVAVCGLGIAVIRMDSHLGLGPHGPGPFSLPREIAALVLAAAALAARAVGKVRWPDADPVALWAVPATAGVLTFAAVPLQVLAIVYLAGVLAATSWRSPAADVSLAVGAVAGLRGIGARGLVLQDEDVFAGAARDVFPCRPLPVPRRRSGVAAAPRCVIMRLVRPPLPGSRLLGWCCRGGIRP